MKGKLYLIPSPIGGEALDSLPRGTLQALHQLNYFIVERTRTARRFLKAAGHPTPIDKMKIIEIPKHGKYLNIDQDLAPLKEGAQIGLMSEAGCPGVADPGAQIVLKAHEIGALVIPLVGPSSILMALMASGFNGQQFTFHGYLSYKKNLIGKDLKALERMSQSDRGSHIFIEAPYRNKQVYESALSHLHPLTHFAVCMNINTDHQFIGSKTIEQWKNSEIPNLHKKPCVFIIQSPIP